jgi:hypothetical protein
MKTMVSLPAGLGGAIVLAAVLISNPSRAQDDGYAAKLKSSGEFGAFFGVVPGVAGGFANPAVQITPGLSFAAGNTVRYHLTFAYSRMSVEGRSANGIDVRPLTLGFPIHIASSASAGFAIEPLLDLIGVQAYFGPGGSVGIFSSGVGVQGVVNFKSAYISLAPLNFQFQYAAVGSANSGSASGGGFGFNMPIRISGGLRF